MTAVLAADIGGTKTTVGLVVDGEVRHRLTRPTPAREGGPVVAAELLGMLEVVRAAASEAPSAVAVGTAGVVESGRITSATQAIRDWAGTDLATLVGAGTGLPAYVLNDVHAHALGEASYGAAVGRDPVLVVAVGTGVGGAFVSGDRLLLGRHGAAGHLGHVLSPSATGIPCACGGIGHLEAVASGPAIVASYRRRGGRTDLDGRGVLASSEPAAVSAVSLAAFALGAALGGWANTFDPEIVVLTGGIATDAAWFAQVVAAVEPELVPAVRRVPVVPAALGADAALLGAAAFATERELVR